MSKFQGGFTIVELVITIALVSLLATPIIINGFQFYVGINSADRRAILYLQSQQALRTITEDLKMASGIETSNTNTDPNKAGGWVTSSSNHVLVIATPAQDNSRNFIVNTSTNKPYLNEIVYFTSGSNLYRRSIPYPVAGNSMTQSCPVAAATPTCPADNVLTSKFDTSSYTLYDASGNTTTIVPSARSIKLNLQIKDTAYSQSATRASSTQVTFRNS